MLHISQHNILELNPTCISFIFNDKGWRKAHPAGSHWIDWYDGRDATEVMDAFHSAKGRQMYARLPKSKKETVAILKETVPDDTSTMLAFRELRQQLEDDGWFERDIGREVILLGIWTSLLAGGIATAHVAPFLSIFLTALTMTQAGWLGHDYVHGVDKWSDFFRQFTTIAGGLGCTWWSDKHNKHHALSKFKYEICYMTQDESFFSYEQHSFNTVIPFFSNYSK